MSPASAAPRRPRVCFVSPYNYPLFNPEKMAIYGGWEVRIYNLARLIAQRGEFQVSVVVADIGQPERELSEGVELIAWKGRVFWGAQPPAPMTADSRQQAAGPTGALVRPAVPPGRRARLKRLYKRCTPWKLRYLLHGLVGGAAHGLQTAWNDFNASVHAVRTVVDVVEELPILPDVVQTLAAADADLYIAPGVSEVAAMTAWYARSSRHPYVMLAGSDRDFSPNILNDPDGRDAHGRPHALLRYVIRSAARHIVQNTNQLELARAFDVSAVLVPNPIDLAPDYPAQPGARQVLWVGNTEQTVKQPQIMLELARRLPEYEFVMIITPIQPDAYAQIEQAAGRLPNLTVCSRIPYRQVEQYFARARCLVNTSVYEGLPNTFLQAGKYRVPLLSLNVDPNGMLTQHNCGLLCGGDLQRLESHLRNLMTDDALHGQLGTNLHAYVQEHHDQHKIIAQVEAIFRSALDQYAQVNR